jgi:hypothetical protein
MPIFSSVWMTPTWAMPIAPPPESTSPSFGRFGGSVGCDQAGAAANRTQIAASAPARAKARFRPAFAIDIGQPAPWHGNDRGDPGWRR